MVGGRKEGFFFTAPSSNALSNSLPSMLAPTLIHEKLLPNQRGEITQVTKKQTACWVSMRVGKKASEGARLRLSNGKTDASRVRVSPATSGGHHPATSKQKHAALFPIPLPDTAGPSQSTPIPPLPPPPGNATRTIA